MHYILLDLRNDATIHVYVASRDRNFIYFLVEERWVLGRMDEEDVVAVGRWKESCVALSSVRSLPATTAAQSTARHGWKAVAGDRPL